MKKLCLYLSGDRGLSVLEKLVNINIIIFTYLAKTY